MRSVIAGSGFGEVEAVEAVADEPADGGGVPVDDRRERRRRGVGADHQRLRRRGDADQHEEHAEDDDQQDPTTRPGLGTEHAPSLGMARRMVL